MSLVKEKKEVLSIKEVMDSLPHAYPFLFVDKVISMDLKKGTMVAIKNVTINEPFFQGHFPGQPIMPGVLIIEALAQVGSICVSQAKVEGLAVLLGVNNFKFRHPVYPGDTLILSIEITHYSSFGGKCKGRALVGDKLCAEGEMIFSILNEKRIK
ncbi:MAG: 3-hydroxyacyl-[acyl-carrier-protein] dehydratase FabZ [Chlamydiia bacterium]|nr:3-hydroxyacyl-[acyl-carrier-protein] dehydratase FabZ [Chlamydiia bacterium]